jgi:hypothetical protein
MGYFAMMSACSISRQSIVAVKRPPQNIGMTSSLSMISDSGKTSSNSLVSGFWQKYLISCFVGGALHGTSINPPWLAQKAKKGPPRPEAGRAREEAVAAYWLMR